MPDAEQRRLGEAPGESGESHDLERLAQSLVGHAAARHRIAHHVAELADRQVRPLRQKEYPGVTRRADLATAKRPDTGDGTDQGALARARGAAQENGAAAPEREVDVRHQGLTIGAIEVDTRHRQVGGAPLDASEATGCLQTYSIERALEAGQPLDHRAPGRDLLVGHDEEAEGILDLVERPHRLHEPSEPELAAEVARRCDDGRYDPRSLRVTGREEGQPLLPAHDTPPVAHHRFEQL